MNRKTAQGLAAILALATFGAIFLPASDDELSVGAQTLADGQATERERAEERRIAALFEQHKAAR